MASTELNLIVKLSGFQDQMLSKEEQTGSSEGWDVRGLTSLSKQLWSQVHYSAGDHITNEWCQKMNSILILLILYVTRKGGQYQNEAQNKAKQAVLGLWASFSRCSQKISKFH